MIVIYSSNNSSGSFWLKDSDWKKLETAGWKVEWYDQSLLGANATSATIATISAISIKAAIVEWESVLGMNASERGCYCCGPPHNFYEGEESNSVQKPEIEYGNNYKICNERNDYVEKGKDYACYSCRSL